MYVLIKIAKGTLSLKVCIMVIEMCRQFCLHYNSYLSIDVDSIGLIVNADVYVYHNIMLARPVCMTCARLMLSYHGHLALGGACMY